MKMRMNLAKGSYTGTLQFIELWFCINLNMSTYQTGSALIATGMTFWQAIITIIIGNAFATSFAVLNSVSGAQSHLGFPIVSRSVWGTCEICPTRRHRCRN